MPLTPLLPNTSGLHTVEGMAAYFDELVKATQTADADAANDAPPLWTPIPDSPQERAYTCDADVIGYGGGSGGGKSGLLIGLALTKHRNSLILRREATQVRTLWRHFRKFVRGHGHANEGLHVIRDLPGDRAVQLGGMKDADDWQAYQGDEYDLMAFDEADQFLQYQVEMVSAWNRTTIPGQKCRMVLTFNPPATAEGRWIIDFFAPWLDPQHPNPAVPGELRYYVVLDGEEREWPNSEPFPFTNEEGYEEIITPKSRTFFPALVWDNPHLRETGYVATLQAMPEPRRSQLLLGDFRAGMEDDAWQVIPTAWILASEERWQRLPRPEGPLTRLGVDVARGGRDATILAPCIGRWVDELIEYPGVTPPDGADVAARVFGELIGRESREALIVIDIIGVGASPFDFLRQIPNLHLYGAVGSRGTDAMDRTRRLRFANTRSWFFWHVRELLDPSNGYDLALPPDRRLRADLCAPRWTPRAGGVIQVEAKEDVVKRLGRSPDRGDAVVLALAPVGLVDRHAVAPISFGPGSRPPVGPARRRTDTRAISFGSGTRAGGRSSGIRVGGRR